MNTVTSSILTSTACKHSWSKMLTHHINARAIFNILPLTCPEKRKKHNQIQIKFHLKNQLLIKVGLHFLHLFQLHYRLHIIGRINKSNIVDLERSPHHFSSKCSLLYFQAGAHLMLWSLEITSDQWRAQDYSSGYTVFDFSNIPEIPVSQSHSRSEAVIKGYMSILWFMDKGIMLLHLRRP